MNKQTVQLVTGSTGMLLFAGATDSDYLVDDVELPQENTTGETQAVDDEKQDRESEEKEDGSVKITFVSCATGA